MRATGQGLTFGFCSGNLLRGPLLRTAPGAQHAGHGTGPEAPGADVARHRRSRRPATHGFATPKMSARLRPLNIRYLRPVPGMRMSLLRILMTNACSFNCHYCPMRRDRAMPRTLLKPEELVRIFLGAHRRGWCEGLFITTGIPGRPVKVMDDLIKALELLRERHRFGGYIHVKLVPGRRPGADRAPHRARQPRVAQPRGRLRRQSRADRAGEELHHDARDAFERVRKLVLEERQAQAARQAEGSAAPRRRIRHDHAVRRRRHARHRPQAPGHGGRALGRRRRAPRALQRVPAHPRHADGERARHACPARAPAVSGRLSAGELRLRRRRGRLRGRRATSRSRSTPRPRGRSRTPSASRSRSARRAVRGAAARAGHRARRGAPDREPSEATRCFAASPISASSASSRPARAAS